MKQREKEARRVQRKAEKPERTVTSGEMILTWKGCSGAPRNPCTEQGLLGTPGTLGRLRMP